MCPVSQYSRIVSVYNKKKVTLATSFVHTFVTGASFGDEAYLPFFALAFFDVVVFAATLFAGLSASFFLATAFAVGFVPATTFATTLPSALVSTIFFASLAGRAVVAVCNSCCDGAGVVACLGASTAVTSSRCSILSSLVFSCSNRVLYWSCATTSFRGACMGAGR